MTSDERTEKRLSIASDVVYIVGHLSMWASLFYMLNHADEFPGLIRLFGGWMTLVMILIAATPAYIGLYISRVMKEKRNRLRRERMRTAARADDRAPFMVLRSFDAGPLTSEPARHHGRGMGIHGVSYARAIANALFPHGQLIAIGAPTDVRNYFEATDALYVQSREEDWFLMFSAALAGVRAVVLIPGVTTGLMREVHAIATLGAWSKVVVFMPPTPDPNESYKVLQRYVDELASEKAWKQVQAKWKESGYDLPEYVREGMVYRAGPGFSIEESVPLAHDIGKLGTAFEDLLAKHGQAGFALKTLLPQLERREVPPSRPGLISRIYLPG
jgi:hypothetical protein